MSVFGDLGVEEAAGEYVKALRSTPNAHGQNVHPVYGRSDFMLRQMWETFGKHETSAALITAMDNHRDTTA